MYIMIAWQLVKEQLQKDFTAPGRNNISQFQLLLVIIILFLKISQGHPCTDTTVLRTIIHLKMVA